MKLKLCEIFICCKILGTKLRPTRKTALSQMSGFSVPLHMVAKLKTRVSMHSPSTVANGQSINTRRLEAMETQDSSPFTEISCS